MSKEFDLDDWLIHYNSSLRVEWLGAYYNDIECDGEKHSIRFTYIKLTKLNNNESVQILLDPHHYLDWNKKYLSWWRTIYLGDKPIYGYKM